MTTFDRPLSDAHQGAPAGPGASRREFEGQDPRLGLAATDRIAVALDWQETGPAPLAPIDWSGSDEAARHIALIEAVGQGFAEVAVARDAGDTVLGGRLIRASPTFSTRFAADPAVMRALFDGPAADMVAGYATAASGRPALVEFQPTGSERWLRLRALPGFGDRIALAVEDVTAARQREREIREAEERQGFLLHLDDAMRTEDSVEAIAALTTRLIAGKLGVAHCWLASVAGDGTVRRLPAGDDVPALLDRPDDQLVVADLADEDAPAPAARTALERMGVRSVLAVPAVERRGGPVRMLAVADRAARRWSAAEIALVRGATDRVWAEIDRAQADERLRESERRLQTLVEGVPQLVWRAADGGRWTWASPQWTAHTGQPEDGSHGFGWLDPVHAEDRDRARQRWQEAAARGAFSAEYRLRGAADGGYRWFKTRATPVRDEAGRIVEWLGTSTDIDDLRQLQARQQTLLAELQHRVRNILTVIRSVFSRTVDAGGALEDIADHFKGRLDSLARTEVIVTRNASGLVDLEALIRDELLSVGASDGPRLTIGGPDVWLGGKVAESIGLAIHELTTNALKYGALRIPGATLDIIWAVNLAECGRRRLDLKWTEQGVPAIPVTPGRTGFGSELIVEALPYRLGAETSLEFRGGGVRCSISVPLPDESGTGPPDAEDG